VAKDDDDDDDEAAEAADADASEENQDLVRNSLEEARTHLEGGQHDRALRSLLAAWRARKVPALADVIDRVSALLTKGPITGKTVAARTETWLAVAKKGAPEDLGALLITPWPGTWKHAKPLVEMVARHYKDDPRLAMALAKIVDATPYDTWTSVQFYRPLFHCLDRILDIRTLPILEAQKTRRKSGYWRASTQKLELAAIDRLKHEYPDGPPTFTTAEEEAVFATIAEQFSGDIAAEQSKARGEADFLADIYKAPDDDAERQVFADWLSERGDPRGEFITIQLAKKAGRTTDAMDKREASLLKKHAKAWLGPLDRVTHKRWRRFEGGFLADVVLTIDGFVKTTSEELLDPAWATVHSLGVPWNICYEPDLCQGILDLPAFANLRVIRGLGETNLRRLVMKDVARPRIEELEVSFDQTTSATAVEERQTVLKAAEIFPSLERFTFQSRPEDVDDVIASPLVKNVKRLCFKSDLMLGQFAAKVMRRGLAQLPRLEEIAVEQASRYTLTRDDESGKFTRLTTSEVGGAGGVPTRWEFNKMLTALAAFDANALTAVRVPPAKAVPYNENDIEQLEAAFAKFPNLKSIDVPWERVQADTASRTADLTPMNLNVQGYEPTFFNEGRVGRLLDRVKEEPLALSFDSYSVNGGKHMSLPTSGGGEEDVRELIMSLMKKKRTKSVSLYRKGASATSLVSLTERTWGLAFGWPNRKTASSDELRKRIDSVVKWVCDLADDEGNSVIVDGTLPFRLNEGAAEMPRNFQVGPFRYGVLGELGFLTILGPHRKEVLSFDGLLDLSQSTEDDLAWLRVVRSKSGSHVVLIAGDTPFFTLDEERRNALAIATWNLLWQRVREREGFVPHELIKEVMGPMLKARGFVEKKLTPILEAQGQVHYYSSSPPNGRGLDFQLFNAASPASRYWWIRGMKRINDPTADNLLDPNQSAATKWIPTNTAHSEEDATKTLTDLEKYIDTDLMEWWSNKQD
jgi:uncharacterized protein (TIGR02996 family)